MRPVWNVVVNLARVVRDVARAALHVVVETLRDPVVLVPLVLVVLLTVSAATDAWVTLWRTSTSSVAVPLWIAELLVLLLVLVAAALFAYAFGDDE